MNFIKKCTIALSTFAYVLSAGAAHAGNLEPASINLGGTSFFDGFGPQKQGFTYLGYYQYHSIDSIKNNSGNDAAAISDPKIDVHVLINQLVYASKKTFFNNSARLGFMGYVSVSHIDTDENKTKSLAPLSSNDGMGDAVLGAFLQFSPSMHNGHPVFSQRMELDVSMPTGEYDSSKSVNAGNNFWMINPYWAATWLPGPRVEVSWRLNYLYNFWNTDPGIQGVSSDRAGQALWLNFTSSYKVAEKFNVGLNGYYFNQITDDRYDSNIPNIAELSGDGGRAKLFAIGPGVQWKPNRSNIWNFNLYDQVYARNHTKGMVFNVHYIHQF